MMVQDNQRLEKMAMQQYRAAIQKETHRSRILDRAGRDLAISVPAWSLYADPREVLDKESVSGYLSQLLGISKQSLLKKLRETRKFVWLKRSIDAAVIEKVNQQKFSGIYALKEKKRFYPHGTLAGTLLGGVGIDSQALGGIELMYDDYLMMTPKAGVYLKDARGRLYLSTMPQETTEEKGDVYLTIDRNIQFFAEEALQKAVKQSHPKGGIVLILDPKTGEILALANYPSLDPNHYDQANPSSWRNRAVTDVYEPGSTFKIITLASVLEQNKISSQEKIDCEGGKFTLRDGRTIHDHKPYGKLTLSELVQVSSNIGVYKLAMRVGAQKLFDQILNFGFGSETGIDFPGEVRGLVRPYKNWRPIDQANISFGQGIGVTPLQMALAFSAIANGGLQMQPHLVEKVVASSGAVLYQAEHKVRRQSISPKTAEKIKNLLKGVVKEGGTATLASLDDYDVAGKTGTAQKIDTSSHSYSKEKYVASFVGFAPLVNPQLVIFVLLDEPKGAYYGGQIAAPVFREVMELSLRYLGLPPMVRHQVAEVQRVIPEDIVNESMSQMGALYKVPDFRGTSLRHVLRSASPFPIEVEVKGRGVAVKQSPQAGTYVTRGSRVLVEFQPLY